MNWFEKDRRHFSRCISEIQKGNLSVLENIPHLEKHAHIIGVTGAPGVGKSTFLQALITELRNQNYSVAVIAVDPTSPFTGGAILGDRIRLSGFSCDEGVFIRSFGSRGSIGGLFDGIYPVVRLFELAGFDKIIIETVGIGQVSLDISDTADTCIVIEAPGMGDDIQAIKAGITEIADIFIVNKSDREGAESTALQLRNMLLMNNEKTKENNWQVPVMLCSAIKHKGFFEIVEKINDHWKKMVEDGCSKSKRNNRLYLEFLTIVNNRIQNKINKYLADDDGFKYIVDGMLEMKYSAHEAGRKFIDIMNKKGWFF